MTTESQTTTVPGTPATVTQTQTVTGPNGGVIAKILGANWVVNVCTVGLGAVLAIWLVCYEVPRQQQMWLDRSDKAHSQFATELQAMREADQRRTEKLWQAVENNTTALRGLTDELKAQRLKDKDK